MYLLTGGAGFIGSAFLAKLNEQGIDDVVVVDELGTGGKWKNLRGKKFIDFLHKDQLFEALDKGKLPKIGAIVHMGACSSTAEPDADYIMENNFHYTVRLAKYALEREVRFIYASSAATYGDGANGYSDHIETLPTLRPLNMYGYSKHLFDLWAVREKVLSKVVGFKFFNVYGPNEYEKGEMISVALKAFREISDTGRIKLFKSHNPKYGDGEQSRDFVYVKDVCDVMIWALMEKGVGGLFNLGSGQARTFLDLGKAVFAALGKEPIVDFVETPEKFRKHYQYFTEADLSNLRAAGCAHRFHSLEEGVRDYVTNYLTDSNYW